MHPPEITNVCQKRDAIIKTTPNYQLPTPKKRSPFRVLGSGVPGVPALCLLRYVAEQLLIAAGILTAAQDPVIKDSDELVRILATVIRNAEHREKTD
jgi:hypothetical protein